VARELDQVALAEELAEERPVSPREARVALARHEELLGRHLRRPHREALLDVGADDRRERRVVLDEEALLRQPAAGQVGERLRRDLVRRGRRRRGRHALGPAAPATEQPDGDGEQQQDAGDGIVGPQIRRHGLDALDVADVLRVRDRREDALDRELRRAGRDPLGLGVDALPAHAGRGQLDVARRPADEREPADDDALPVDRALRLDPEVDDVEVADALRRLLDDDLDARVGGHLDRVADRGADGGALGLDRRPHGDGARVGRERARRQGQDEQQGPHGYWRRSRMTKKRRSESA
jgi:hypothetical protein